MAALLDPDPEQAAEVRTDRAGLAHDGRSVALELRRLVEGDLAGMFDGPTSSGLRVDAPIVALDLSAVFASPALSLLMTCATGWLQAILGAPGGAKRLVVVDEAWAVLHDLATARWLQATFKLARSLGVVNVAVVHRLSDLRAAGDAGSAQQRLAEGLLADTETRVLFGQAPAEASASREQLHLTGRETELVASLPRGVALWKVGQRSFVVDHGVSPRELDLVDTDAAMRDGTP
jgi:type IV secretory pathway VirB4 component